MYTVLDQYAFKPTGSTTAALVHLTHKITNLLEDNNYVRCLVIDFSKAFDTVDHVMLLSKIAQLDLPGYVVKWICSFLSGIEVNGVKSMDSKALLLLGSALSKVLGID